MSAPTIVAILQGIATRLETVQNLNVADVFPGQVSVDTAVIGVPAIPNYRLTMRRGTFDLNPTITVFVSAADGQNGQYRLAEYASPTGDRSIRKAVEGTDNPQTLGGVVASCHVESFRPLGIDEHGAIGYFAGQFTLYIAAEGGD